MSYITSIIQSLFFAYILVHYQPRLDFSTQLLFLIINNILVAIHAIVSMIGVKTKYEKL